jgi:hypothetical protein
MAKLAALVRLTLPFLMAAATLGACERREDVDPRVAARTKAAVAATQPNGAELRFRRLWVAELAGGANLICGRVEAPSPLVVYEEGRRFIFDDSGGTLRLAPQGDATRTGAEGQDRHFEEMWASACATGEG